MTVQLPYPIQAGLIGLLGFALPISTAATNLIMLLLTGWILLRFATEMPPWQYLARQPLALIALALFSLMLASTIYAPVDWATAWDTIDKYREFLFIPIFLLILHSYPALRRIGLLGLLSAMLLTLLLSYLIALDWALGKGTPDNPYVFKNHITQGILMSLTAYALVVWAIQYPRWRIGLLLLAVLAAYNVLFMTQGRTGYLLLASLALLLVFQVYRWRGLVLGGLLLLVFSALAYSQSNILQARVDKTWHSVEAYQQGQADTSIGVRLQFYRQGFKLFLEHPWLGIGAGGFSPAYAALVAETDKRHTDNLHNEYLMMAVQWGIVGLGLFLLFLYWLWHASFKLSCYQQWFAQGLLVVISVGCLFNSLWLDNTEGHVFAFLIALLYSHTLRDTPVKTE